MKNSIVVQLLARYAKKLQKNQVLESEFQAVYQKFNTPVFFANPEVLKLLCRLEKRLLSIQGQNKNIQAIITMLQEQPLSLKTPEKVDQEKPLVQNFKDDAIFIPMAHAKQQKKLYLVLDEVNLAEAG